MIVDATSRFRPPAIRSPNPQADPASEWGDAHPRGRDVERHPGSGSSAEVSPAVAVPHRDERFGADAAGDEIRIQRQRQIRLDDVQHDRFRASQHLLTVRSTGVDVGDRGELGEQRTVGRELDHVHVLFERTASPQRRVADAPDEPQLRAAAAHRLEQVCVLDPHRIGPRATVALHRREEDRQGHARDHPVEIDLVVGDRDADLAVEVGDVERAGHARVPADRVDIDAQMRKHARPDTLRPSERRPARRESGVAAQRQERDETLHLQRAPSLSELARTNARHQHPEGEDPTRCAVAVGERQTGFVERLHDTGLPRNANSAARQHQRALWFGGHRSYASLTRTTPMRAAAEASNAARATACLPNRFERTP